MHWVFASVCIKAIFRDRRIMSFLDYGKLPSCTVVFGIANRDAKSLRYPRRVSISGKRSLQEIWRGMPETKRT